jgi:hypothetical protein
MELPTGGHAKRHWTGKCEYPLTSTYERGHLSTFGEKPSRYCEGCGLLPAFCECPGRWVDPCVGTKNMFVRKESP